MRPWQQPWPVNVRTFPFCLRSSSWRKTAPACMWDCWQRVMKARARSFLIILIFPSTPTEEVILLRGRHQPWRVSRLHSGPIIVFFKQDVLPHAHYGTFFHFCTSTVDKTHRQLVAWHGNYRLSTFHHFKIKIVSHLKPVELYFWQSSNLAVLSSKLLKA